MVYAAKRGKSRCPTHPGALLRNDIIPATGRTKAEIAGLLGISRQHLYDILQEKTRCLRSSRFDSVSFLVMGRESGLACRLLTIPGMQNEPKMFVTSRPSRRTLLDLPERRRPKSESAAFCGQRKPGPPLAVS
jgi:hypothetical protein